MTLVTLGTCFARRSEKVAELKRLGDSEVALIYSRLRSGDKVAGGVRRRPRVHKMPRCLAWCQRLALGWFLNIGCAEITLLNTMTKKQEQATLRELLQIYGDCPGRVRTYIRWRRISRGIAWVVIFIAFFLSSSEGVNPMISSLVALLGGIGVGISILFSLSVSQVPLLVRYTTLHEDAIRRRSEDLTN